MYPQHHNFSSCLDPAFFSTFVGEAKAFEQWYSSQEVAVENTPWELQPDQVGFIGGCGDFSLPNSSPITCKTPGISGRSRNQPCPFTKALFKFPRWRCEAGEGTERREARSPCRNAAAEAGGKMHVEMPQRNTSPPPTPRFMMPRKHKRSRTKVQAHATNRCCMGNSSRAPSFPSPRRAWQAPVRLFDSWDSGNRVEL